MESDVRRFRHPDVDPVVVERPQPQLSGQLDGRPALQGEQEGVRETGQGLRRAELVRRLNRRRPKHLGKRPSALLSVVNFTVILKQSTDDEKKKA